MCSVTAGDGVLYGSVPSAALRNLMAYDGNNDRNGYSRKVMAKIVTAMVSAGEGGKGGGVENYVRKLFSVMTSAPTSSR